MSGLYQGFWSMAVTLLFVDSFFFNERLWATKAFNYPNKVNQIEKFQCVFFQIELTLGKKLFERKCLEN